MRESLFRNGVPQRHGSHTTDLAGGGRQGAALDSDFAGRCMCPLQLLRLAATQRGPETQAADTIELNVEIGAVFYEDRTLSSLIESRILEDADLRSQRLTVRG